MKKLPEKFFEPTYFPTEDEFMDYYMNINMNGDPSSAQDILGELLSNSNIYTPEDKNERISFGYLIIKYKKYIKWWNAKFSNKEEKFIGKLDKKKTPGEFLNFRLFNKLYSIERASRDDYIFSKLSFDVLHKKLEIFNKLLYGDNYESKNNSNEIKKIKSKSNNNNNDILITDKNPF